MPLALPALVTLPAVLWYVVTGIQVGRARTKHKVYAPATVGDPGFERAFRVQMNELEQIVAFLPAMWVFAWFGNPRFAALAGAVWLAGRVVYAVGYWAEARRRHAGFTISTFALSITWVAALASVVRVLGFAA
jgi:glutathione S-transferase